MVEHWFRRDISHLLIHWTKKTEAGTAYENLTSILKTGIRGAPSPSDSIDEKIVCFTEMPIHEAAAMFVASNHGADIRYEPFGVAISKRWLYEHGGRPVIYGSEEEREVIPEQIRWRFKVFDPPDHDTTWEREWRFGGDHLFLPEDAETGAVIPNQSYARGLIESTARPVIHGKTEEDNEGVWHPDFDQVTFESRWSLSIHSLQLLAQSFSGTEVP